MTLDLKIASGPQRLEHLAAQGRFSNPTTRRRDRRDLNAYEQINGIHAQY